MNVTSMKTIAYVAAHDEDRARHAREEERVRHARDEDRVRHEHDEDRARHAREEERVRHARDEDRVRHEHDEDRARHDDQPEEKEKKKRGDASVRRIGQERHRHLHVRWIARDVIAARVMMSQMGTSASADAMTKLWCGFRCRQTLCVLTDQRCSELCVKMDELRLAWAAGLCRKFHLLSSGWSSPSSRSCFHLGFQDSSGFI